MGIGNAVTSQSAGVSYGDGRYGKGLMVKDTTQVAWTVNLPQVFHTSFWFIPQEVTTCVIWKATGPVGHLLLGYDAQTQGFILEDHLSRRITLAFGLETSDRVCLGVCQTSSERRLFAARMGGDVHSASARFEPVGAFSSLRLY
jgi:hypothetical protein